MPLRRGSGGLSVGGTLFDRPGFFDYAEIDSLTVDTKLLLKAASETYGISITHASTTNNEAEYNIEIPDIQANDVFMLTGLAQTLSNKTLASPKITTGIFDSNGNELLLVTATTLAVNELTLANAAASNSPVLSATGGDDNIGITLTPKGTGVVRITGGLTVDGATTTIDSTTLTVDDKNIELGSVDTPTDTTADGGGITLKGATDKTLIWDNTNDNWTSNQDWNLPTGKVFKINNVSVLNATTLGGAVVNSSLTSTGALAGGSIASGFGNIDVGTDSSIAGGSLTIDTITIDGSTISSTGALIFDADTTLNFSDDSVINIGTLKIDTIEADNTNIGIGNAGDDRVQLNKVSLLTASTDLDIGTHDFRAATITADTLTAGRVIFAGTDGLLSDDSGLTYGSAILTATNIAAFTLTGKLTAGSTEIEGSNFAITGGSIDGVTIGTNAEATEIRVDNLTLDGNTLSSTDTDGHIILVPNGTGDVLLRTDTVQIGDLNALALLTSQGTGSIKLNTNAGTDSGHIQINAGADGAIDITPNGTGDVNITNVDIGSGNIDGTTLGASSAVTLSGATIDGALTWSAAQNLNNQNLTNVDINSGTINFITSFGIKQAATAYEMQIATGATTLTANRVVTIDSKNAARAITLTGDLTLAGNFITAGAYATTLTTTGTTGLTLPTTGTLTTLAGSETLTNKTLTSPVIATIVNNSNNLTLPTSADTLVGRATTDTLTNKTISGSSNTLSNIANSSLSNSAITIGGTATSLGGTITALTALTDLDLTVGNKTIFDTVGSNTLTLGASGTTIKIAGHLEVAGSTTTVSSTTVTIADPIFNLGGNSVPSSDDNLDRGISFRWYDGSADAARIGFFGYDDSVGKFIFVPNATISSEVVSGTAGTLVATTFEGALSGNATSATTAAAWTTARTLSFTGDVTGTGNVDGSAPVATALTIGSAKIDFGMLADDIFTGAGTAFTSVDPAADYLLLYDNSGTAIKRVIPNELGVSGLAAGGSNLIQYANSTAFAGATNVEIKNNSLALKEQATPNATSGYGMIYAKTDNELYYRNDTNAEVQLTLAGAMGGGGAFRGTKAYLTANNTIGTDSATTPTAWTESYDVGAIHSASTNTDRFTFGVAGYYEIKVQQEWAADAAGYREMRVTHIDTSNSNAANVILRDRMDGSSQATISGSSTMFYADDASDYLTVQLYQNSGADLVATGNNDDSTAITISRIDMATGIAQSAGASGRVQLSDGSGNFTSDSDLTFSGSTLTATNIAGTLTTAAQAAITSVGTLTGLTVNGTTTLNDSGGNYDFRVKGDNNANMIYVDASRDVISFGTAPSDDIQFYISNSAITATANANFHRMYLSSQGYVTIPSGTSAYVSTLTIEEPWISEAGGVGVQNATTLRIVSAPTEGNTTNYALWVDAGTSRFDGEIIISDIASPPTVANSGFWLNNSNSSRGLYLNDSSRGSNAKLWSIRNAGEKLSFKTHTDNSVSTVLNVMTLLRDGKVGIGTSAPSSNVEIAASDAGVILELSSWDANTVGNTGFIRFQKSRHATIQTFGETIDGEWLGALGFYGSDSSSTSSQQSAFIRVIQDGAASSNQVASYMSFGTGTSSAVATERMRIDSSGKIGIGQPPAISAPLHVYHATNDTIGIFQSGDAIAILKLRASDSDATYPPQLRTDGNIIKLQGGTSAGHAAGYVAVAANGKVGINTTNPQATLEAQISDSGTNTVPATAILSHKTSGNAVDGFGSALLFSLSDAGVSNAGLGYIGIVRNGADYSGKIVFAPNNAGTYVSSAMTLNNTNRLELGAGNTDNSPVILLNNDNAGTAAIEMNSNTSDGGSYGNNQIKFYARSANDRYSAIEFYDTTTHRARIGIDRSTTLFGSGAAVGNLVIGTKDAKDIEFFTTDASRMIILATGSVGIGTTAPEGALHLAAASGGAKLTFQDKDVNASGEHWDINVEDGNFSIEEFTSSSGARSNSALRTRWLSGGSSRFYGDVTINSDDSGEQKLIIGDTNDVGIIEFLRNGPSYIDTKATAGSLIIRTGATPTNTVEFFEDQTTRFLGRVGIGNNASSTYQLYVYDTGARYAALASSNGNMGLFYRNVSGDSQPVVDITQEHASNAYHALRVRQYGTGYAVDIQGPTVSGWDAILRVYNANYANGKVELGQYSGEGELRVYDSSNNHAIGMSAYSGGFIRRGAAAANINTAPILHVSQQPGAAAGWAAIRFQTSTSYSNENWYIGSYGHASSNTSRRFSIANNAGTEVFNVNYDGNVGIGTASPGTKLDMRDGTYTDFRSTAYSTTNAETARVVLRKSHHDTIGTATATVDGEAIGEILFHGYDGSQFDNGARIAVHQNGSVDTKVPTDMSFWTSTSTAAQEKVRFTSVGHLEVYGLNGYAGLPANSASSQLVGTLSVTHSGGSTITVGAWGNTGYNQSVALMSANTGHTPPIRFGSNNARDVGIVTSASVVRMTIATSDGDITGTHGTYHDGSDERIKKDIVTIPDALTKVAALRGVNFKWKDESKGDNLRMGLIAQEVEAIIPEVVHTQDTEEALKSVEYQYITGLLIEAIKELKAEVDALKA